MIRRYVRAAAANPLVSQGRNSKEANRDTAMEQRGVHRDSSLLVYSTRSRDDNEDPNDPISSQFTSPDRTQSHFSTVDESQFP
eukprot:SAG11_NODE_14144_length_623_cov_1.272901_1_plen_82_part_01